MEKTANRPLFALLVLRPRDGRGCMRMRLRLLATALCFTAAVADSPPKDSPELHQPELIEPIHRLPVADDLVEVHRGEGGRGLLATIGASPTGAAEDAISDAGIPALMDAPHQPAAKEGPAATAAAATAAAAAAPQRRWELTDYTGRPLNESSAALDQRCQQAVNEVLEREAAQTGPPLYSDPLQGVPASSQSPRLAVPELGSFASAGRAWRLRAAQHSRWEAQPRGAQPPPRVLERAASEVADFSVLAMQACSWRLSYADTLGLGLGLGLALTLTLTPTLTLTLTLTRPGEPPYQPPACCTYRRLRVACPGGPRTMRMGYVCQPRACCTYRVPCGA